MFIWSTRTSCLKMCKTIYFRTSSNFHQLC